MFYIPLEQGDIVKFSFSSSQPIIFMYRTSKKRPTFSYKLFRSNLIFNGSMIDEYTGEYIAETKTYLVFRLTTAQPLRAYLTRPEYSANVTFNGRLYKLKNA
jgi:hypothetical protein